MPHHPDRRAFLGTVAASALVAPAVALSGTRAHAQSATPESEAFTYEVTRTEAEWRALLSPEEYRILRELGTEPRFSSDLAAEERPGTYHCRGCDLTIYDADQKTVRLIGWVFFFHARPDSVLMGIDEFPAAMTNSEGIAEARLVTEAHCRRCGSHLGHILQVQQDILHCINGAALEFRPETA